jgi:hypothetical protein
MNVRELLFLLDLPWNNGDAEEELRQRMQAFLVKRVGVALEHYFYWPPHCAFSIDIFVDDQLLPVLKDSKSAELQITIYVSSKTSVATFRIRRRGEKPWWESDRRWTFDPTTKVFGLAHGHAQALCDEFNLQLLLPDPMMDGPLPGRFRKLDPKGPATIFTELFSEM